MSTRRHNYCGTRSLNYSRAVVAGIVVAMGFAMLALAFTRTEKPSGISIEELDYLMEL